MAAKSRFRAIAVGFALLGVFATGLELTSITALADSALSVADSAYSVITNVDVAQAGRRTP